MAEGPGAVGRRPLGGAAVVGLLLPLGEPFRVDQVVRGQHLGVLVVEVLELVRTRTVGQVEHPLRVRDPLLLLGLGGGAGRGVVVAEQLGGLVEQRNIGGSPIPASAVGTADGLRVGLLQMHGLREEVRDQFLRREGRPQLRDGGVHLGAGRDRLAEHGGVVGPEEVRPAVRVRADPVRELRGERVDDVEREVRPREVVRQRGRARGVPRLARDVRVQQQFAVLVVDDDGLVGRRQRLPVPYEPGQRVGHRRPALDLGGARGVGAGCGHAREEVAGRGEQDPGLAERGQHLRDIAEERRVRPDDQHGPARQQLPVRVEQIRGPVQRHDGLPGAGPALHDEDAAVRRADDPVLFRLDGLHDVVHPAGARGVQRGQQHGVRVGALVPGTDGVGEVHQLVVQRGDPPARRGDVPPPAQPHRGVPGREVERPRHLRPPVDDQRRALRVVAPHPDPPDVVITPVPERQPSETQPALPGVERRQQPGPLGHQHFPLQPRLMPVPLGRQHLPHRALGLGAQFGQPLVEKIDEFLLFSQFRV